MSYTQTIATHVRRKVIELVFSEVQSGESTIIVSQEVDTEGASAIHTMAIGTVDFEIIGRFMATIPGVYERQSFTVNGLSNSENFITIKSEANVGQIVYGSAYAIAHCGFNIRVKLDSALQSGDKVFIVLEY